MNKSCDRRTSVCVYIFAELPYMDATWRQIICEFIYCMLNRDVSMSYTSIEYSLSEAPIYKILTQIYIPLDERIQQDFLYSTKCCNIINTKCFCCIFSSTRVMYVITSLLRRKLGHSTFSGQRDHSLCWPFSIESCRWGMV